MSSRPAKPVLPQRIGRYGITKLLGKGGQGVVMLADDDELGRQVAIKLLRHDPTRPQARLVTEARIVSRLQHPNIVTLYDVGTYSQLPYLVFEFIDGESLQDRIARTGKLEFSEAIILMSQILGGVSYLHENEIVHRDLSPANILLTRDGAPKVTDFGISVLRQANEQKEEAYAGTLRYMAPEPFTHEIPGPPSDVFTLASIFYEMLTGKRLYVGENPGTIINAIVSGPPLDVAAHGLDVPAEIAELLLRATQRPVARRYPNAREMKNKLDEYRLPRENDGGVSSSGHSTIEFLMRRMNVKTGFSTLSQHVSEILEITADDSNASAGRLVNILAKDVTLSQRVLTMANSAFYGSSEITALPRAIVLLGLDQVRMCITTALLNGNFEAGSEILRAALTRSFHAAILAKAVAPAFGVRNRAEAFTAALYHDLGRFLTMHYFEEEYVVICDRADRNHSDELTESRAVLGVPFHELGCGVAKQWKFSAGIIEAMRPLPRGTVTELGDNANAALRYCAAWANAVSHIISEHASPDHRDIALAELAAKVAAISTLSSKDFDLAVAEAAELTRPYARLNRLDVEQHAGIGRLLEFEKLAGAA